MASRLVSAMRRSCKPGCWIPTKWLCSAHGSLSAAVVLSSAAFAGPPSAFVMALSVLSSRRLAPRRLVQYGLRQFTLRLRCPSLKLPQLRSPSRQLNICHMRRLGAITCLRCRHSGCPRLLPHSFQWDHHPACLCRRSLLRQPPRQRFRQYPPRCHRP